MKNQKYKHNLINKALTHYKYSTDIDKKEEINEFYRRYSRSYKNYIKNKYDFKTFYGRLSSIPNLTHILAKYYLFIESEKCWKYFERTAVFWTYSHINDEWIDHLKFAYEYSLYVENHDLLEILIEKSFSYLSLESYKISKNHIIQDVYPSTQLVHFLVEKTLGHNPVKPLVLNYGNSYGIYQKIIDNWDDFSNISNSYWNELCEYHLNSMGLQNTDRREHEEFLGSGLIPMELINIFKLRKKLNLDIPVINHELFQTPMAKYPKLPTGYNPHMDVLFRLIRETIKYKKLFTYKEIENIITLESEDTFPFY